MKRDTALKYIADKNIKDELAKEAIGKNYLEQETERLKKIKKTKTKGGLSEELNPPSIFSQLGGK